jgi:hypothetical protein
MAEPREGEERALHHMGELDRLREREVAAAAAASGLLAVGAGVFF